MAAVILEGVSKKFILRHDRPRSFQETFLSMLRGDKKNAPEEFWALRDVSFELTAGETMGLIGPNGAGKSTVLKLISRIIEPTAGRIKVNGRVGALLELGAGFHPDLTGQENIYLNGSIMGLSRAEVRRKLAEIIDFAELERFIDVPVKHYSSGMYVRLGFSVAVHTNPEILLVDEVLTVGDEHFQKRCMEKVNDLHRAGVAILLVSHNLALIKDFCTRTAWMDRGTLKMCDATEAVIAAYIRQTRQAEEVRLEQRNQERPTRYGNGLVCITKVEMIGADGKARWIFEPGELVRVRVHYETANLVEMPIFSVLVHRDDGLYVSGANTYQGVGAGSGLPPIEGQGCVEVEFESLALARGTYLLSVGVYTAPDPPFWTNPADFHDKAYRFSIDSEQHVHGVLALRMNWRLMRDVEG